MVGDKVKEDVPEAEKKYAKEKPENKVEEAKA
jgi:hypothetical protein